MPNSLRFCDRNNLYTDMDHFVADRIHKLASNLVEWDDHVLNACFTLPKGTVPTAKNPDKQVFRKFHTY